MLRASVEVPRICSEEITEITEIYEISETSKISENVGFLGRGVL